MVSSGPAWLAASSAAWTAASAARAPTLADSSTTNTTWRASVSSSRRGCHSAAPRKGEGDEPKAGRQGRRLPAPAVQVQGEFGAARGERDYGEDQPERLLVRVGRRRQVGSGRAGRGPGPAGSNIGFRRVEKVDRDLGRRAAVGIGARMNAGEEPDVGMFAWNRRSRPIVHWQRVQPHGMQPFQCVTDEEGKGDPYPQVRLQGAKSKEHGPGQPRRPRRLAPRSHGCRRRFRAARCSGRPRSLNGSSMISTSGSTASALAMPTRCCIPPLISCG